MEMNQEGGQSKYSHQRKLQQLFVSRGPSAYIGIFGDMSRASTNNEQYIIAQHSYLIIQVQQDTLVVDIKTKDSNQGGIEIIYDQQVNYKLQDGENIDSKRRNKDWCEEGARKNTTIMRICT